MPGSARSLLPSLSLALRGNRAVKEQRDSRNQKKKILTAGAEPRGQEGRLQTPNSGLLSPGPQRATSRREDPTGDGSREEKWVGKGKEVDGLDEQGSDGGNPDCRGCFSIPPHLLDNNQILFSG